MPRTDARGGPQTRARISELATRLFLERGFDSVTVAEVARVAGVSSVTVFKHFPRKEDLLLDRADDAVELLRSAVRDRSPGVDVLESLRDMTIRLSEERHGLSGTSPQSVPFFGTVAASAALVARAREIADELQRTLAEELEHDEAFDGNGPLLAAFFIAGYASLLADNARRLIGGEPSSAVAQDHPRHLDQLYEALRHGVLAQPPKASVP